MAPIFRKTIFLIVLFSCTSHLFQAQRFYTLNDDKNYIDSLKTIIAKTNSDSVRCMNLFKLADLFRRNKNIGLSTTYLKEANLLAPRSSFLTDVSIYYNASQFLNTGDFEGYNRQLVAANEQLKKYDHPTAYSLRAFILKNLAVLQQMKNNEKEAARILVNEAIPLAQKSHDFEVMSIIYNTLGIIFMNNENRQKADYYINMAIKCAEQADKRSYQLLEIKIHAYIINAENATQLNKRASAQESLDKAFAVLKNYPESNLNGVFYQAQGLLYHGLGNFNAAIKSFDLGIKNCELYRDEAFLNNLKFVKAQSLTKLKRYREARDLLIEMADRNNENIEDARLCYNQIIINCDKIGDLKNAYTYSKKYIALTDSLYKINSKKEIEELEAKYNTSEKEKQIHQLEAQKQKALFISERNKFNYRFFGLLSVLLLLVVVFLWKNAITQKKLAGEKEKNYAQHITTLKKQREIDVMQASISTEEEERKRIARDLHDGVGSSLSSLKMRLTNFAASHELLTTPDFETLLHLLNRSIGELRQVAYNLLPETISRLGLKHALQDLCYYLKTDAVSIEFYSGEIDREIYESDQINLFRIVQELLNNSLKHANCNEIILNCSQNQHLFLITVEDNGIGFNTATIDTFEGQGLKNLKNRVNLLNGKIDIDSSINAGTTINIELYIRLKT